MSNGEAARCGWQVPGNVPGAFDWWLFGVISASAAAVAYVSKNGIPIINGILGITGGPFIGVTAAAVGALAVLSLVAYYLLRPDGCVRSKPRSESVCCSGIVVQVTEGESAWTIALAPFAIGPWGTFDVVLKSQYLYLVTQGADFIICAENLAQLLRCVVKSEISCGARIGAMVGATAGAVAGVILGYLAGAAVYALACGPFAWLCFILAVIVAALVAAAITYGGAMLGGWIGAGIALIGEDEVQETAEALTPGTIVTVVGDWTKNPDHGYNELFYVTALHRTGDRDNPPYTSEDADATPEDDCGTAPVVQ